MIAFKIAWSGLQFNASECSWGPFFLFSALMAVLLDAVAKSFNFAWPGSVRFCLFVHCPVNHMRLCHADANDSGAAGERRQHWLVRILGEQETLVAVPNHIGSVVRRSSVCWATGRR